MKSHPYGPPIAVSPLIRGTRYVFLLAGIFYGVSKQRVYEKKEELWKEQEAKRKIIRDREDAILRAKIAAEEREAVKLLETGKLFDPPPPIILEEPKKKRKPRVCEDE